MAMSFLLGACGRDGFKYGDDFKADFVSHPLSLLKLHAASVY